MKSDLISVLVGSGKQVVFRRQTIYKYRTRQSLWDQQKRENNEHSSREA